MPSPQESTMGIVLKVTSSGEKFILLSVLSPTLGLLKVYDRSPSSKSRHPRIGLYDNGTFTVDLKQDRHTAFLKEFDLETRYSGLSRSYETLQSAATISHLLADNPVHEDNSASLFLLVAQALESLSEGHFPMLVTIKTLFVYCRDEGYAVIGSWVAGLSPSLKTAAIHIINTPLAQIDVQAHQASSVLTSLSNYIERETHIRLS